MISPRRLPIRARVTAAFAGAMMLLLVAIGIVVYWSMSAALLDELDSGLRYRAAAIASSSPSSLVITANPTLEEPVEAFIQLLTSRGRIIRASAGLPPVPLLDPRDLTLVNAPVFFVRHVGGVQDSSRLLAMPVTQDGVSEILIVGTTMSDRTDALRVLLLVFAAGGPVAILLASLCGWWFAGLGLRPVERMRRQAAAITASGLDHRLDLPVADDELHRLAVTLNQMLDRLEAAASHDRMFLEHVSHELRTPLTALKAELDVAATGPGDAAALSAAIAGATEETNRVIRLANDLLALARTRSGRMPIRRAPCDPRWLLESAAAANHARATAHGITLAIDTDGGPACLDAMRVRQVLDNLVDNSLRHTEPGGTITLTAHAITGRIQISVRDTGSGFAAPDTAAPDTLPGRGLGLRIAQAVAASHDGRLRIGNCAPRGAVVTLELPAAE